jgi:hypothetical protein
VNRLQSKIEQQGEKAMSADNYYVVMKHPTGGFAAVMGFASAAEPPDPPAVDARSWPTIDEVLTSGEFDDAEYGISIDYKCVPTYVERPEWLTAYEPPERTKTAAVDEYLTTQVFVLEPAPSDDLAADIIAAFLANDWVMCSLEARRYGGWSDLKLKMRETGVPYSSRTYGGFQNPALPSWVSEHLPRNVDRDLLVIWNTERALEASIKAKMAELRKLRSKLRNMRATDHTQASSASRP